MGRGQAAGRMNAIVADFVATYGALTEPTRSRPHHPIIAMTESSVGYLAFDPRTARRVVRERRLLEWAGGQGLPVPRVVETDAAKLVVKRVARDDPSGEAYTSAAIETALQIAKGSTVPPGKGKVRRQGRVRSLPLRAARLASGPLPMREFLSARRSAHFLERDAVAHADFHPGNVLHDASDGTIHVVDWQHAGRAPRHTDLVFLWTHLRSPADRTQALEAVLSIENDRAHVARLMHWFSIRAVAETFFRVGAEPADVERRWSVLAEARRFATSLR